MKRVTQGNIIGNSVVIIACGGSSKQETCETNLEAVKRFAQSWICTILGTFVICFQALWKESSSITLLPVCCVLVILVLPYCSESTTHPTWHRLLSSEYFDIFNVIIIVSSKCWTNLLSPVV